MSKAAEATQVKPEKVENFQPTQQAEARIDSSQFQVNDTKPLQGTQPKSAEDLSGQLNALYNGPGGPERFDNINKDLAKSFKSVYENTPGGEADKIKGVKAFEDKINDGTVQGKGILAQVDKDGKLSVRHLEATTSGEKHPEIAGVHIKDIGNKLTTDLRPEQKLEQATGGSKDQADTKQFPSDVLFQKALTANPEWAKARWDGVNDPQKKLLSAIKDPAVKALADSLPPGMLDAAAGTPKQVNDFLEKQGFGRLLQERPNEEAVAATLKIQKDWKAEKSTMESGGKTYSSVDKDGKVHEVDGKKFAELYKDPKDGITVFAIPNKPGITGQQAMEDAKSLVAKANEGSVVDRGNIRAPMINMNVAEDLNWLKGMKGDDLTIRQAKMQTILKMDENGFDAKQAIALGGTRGFKVSEPIKPKMELNSEFTFVVAKDGKPLFAMPVEKENWKDPKSR